MERKRNGRAQGERLLCFRALAAAGLLLGCLGAGPALAAEVPVMGPAEVRKVVPVGKAVGIKLFSDGVLVVGFSQIPAAEGSVVPARQCGLKEGDIITHINAAEVDTVEEVQEQLAEMVGVRRETIARLEKAQYNPSLRLAVDISRAVGAPIEEIFIFR